jgi:hypothetical protein
VRGPLFSPEELFTGNRHLDERENFFEIENVNY